MDKTIRRMLGGMSTASLILAGSIPLMAQTGSTDKSSKSDKAMSKTDLKDTKGHNDCQVKAKTATKTKPKVKDTAGYGGSCKGSNSAPAQKAK
jgi:hypothetical protein